MTLDEAVALLREARNSVALEVAAVAAFRVSEADKRVLDLLGRINAALAAHDAEPAAVEWRECGRHTEDASIDGAYCMLRYVGGSTGWLWDVTRTGTTRSLYDARAAAEKAARGGR